MREESIDQQTHVFTLAGFAEDQGMVDEFRAALRRALEGGKTRLVVDVSGLLMPGLETTKLLLGAQEWVEPSGGSVVLVFPPEMAWHTMLASSGLDRKFPVRPTPAEALELLARGG